MYTHPYRWHTMHHLCLASSGGGELCTMLVSMGFGSCVCKSSPHRFQVEIQIHKDSPPVKWQQIQLQPSMCDIYTEIIKHLLWSTRYSKKQRTVFAPRRLVANGLGEPEGAGTTRTSCGMPKIFIYIYTYMYMYIYIYVYMYIKKKLVNTHHPWYRQYEYIDASYEPLSKRPFGTVQSAFKLNFPTHSRAKKNTGWAWTLNSKLSLPTFNVPQSFLIHQLKTHIHHYNIIIR